MGHLWWQGENFGQRMWNNYWGTISGTLGEHIENLEEHHWEHDGNTRIKIFHPSSPYCWWASSNSWSQCCLFVSWSSFIIPLLILDSFDLFNLDHEDAIRSLGGSSPTLEIDFHNVLSKTWMKKWNYDVPLKNSSLPWI